MTSGRYKVWPANRAVVSRQLAFISAQTVV